MDRDLILISGASSDIGLALIRALALSGENSTILAHCNSSGDRIEIVQREAGPGRVIPLIADFRSSESVEAMADRVLSEYGPPGKFIHLPGLKLVYERFSKFDWQHFENDLNIQIRAAILMLRKFLPPMSKMTNARVVFVVSSVTRCVPPKFMSMYVVIKHAQLGLMKALASEYSGTGVSINAVSPGMVDTRFLDQIPDMAKQMAASANPRQRNATPEDVVGAIQFLLSPGTAYITGIELPVTGGSVY